MSENNVCTAYVTGLMCAGRHGQVMETISKMATEERACCCHKLIFFIEGCLNTYVNRY